MNKQTYVAPTWRFDVLIDAQKPYRRIAERLHAKGYPMLPLSTIAGWRKRNSMPPYWVPAMIELGLEAGVIQTIDNLRVGPTRRHRNAQHSGTDQADDGRG